MKYLIVLILMFFAPLLFAQEPQKPRITIEYDLENGETISTTYVQEIAPTSRVPLEKHVLFIVDCSSSMRPHKISEAMIFVQGITMQPIDQMQFGVLIFDTPTSLDPGFARWPGIPEPDAPVPVPEGWAALPSAEAINRAISWIRVTQQRRLANHNRTTKIVPALEQALKESRNNLSIVIVTDGVVYDGHQNVLTALRNAIASRQEADLEPVTIMAYGVNNKEEKKILSQIALMGGGGYYRKDAN